MIRESRFLVNVETYICGAAFFLKHDTMGELRHFLARDTNKAGAIGLRPQWVKSGEIWLLQNKRQVYGAFAPSAQQAMVAIKGPNWRTFLFVQWLGEYLADVQHWQVTYLQSTERLDSLKVPY